MSTSNKDAKTIKELQAKLQLAKQKYANLKKSSRDAEEKNKSITNQLLTSSTGANAIQPNEDVVISVTNCVKFKMWRKAKFLRDDNELETLTKETLKEMPGQNLDVDSEDPEMKVKVAQWVATYSNTVCETINERRSYAQAQCKNAVFDWVEENPDLDFPKSDILVRIAERDESLDLEDEYIQKALLWYHDSLILKVATVKWWPPTTKCYCTISGAKTGEGDDAIQWITVGTEAFLVVLFENCEEKWQSMVDEWKKNPNKKFNTKEDRDPFAKLQYTNSKSGQCKFGGWNKKGIKHWRKLRASIAQGRALPHSATIEAKMLELTKKKHGIKEKNHHETTKKCKRKVVEDSDSSGDEEDIFD